RRAGAAGERRRAVAAGAGAAPGLPARPVRPLGGRAVQPGGDVPRAGVLRLRRRPAKSVGADVAGAAGRGRLAMSRSCRARSGEAAAGAMSVVADTVEAAEQAAVEGMSEVADTVESKRD